MKNKINYAIGRFFQKVSRWFFDHTLMACWHCGALVGMNSTFANDHMWCEPCFQRYVAPERYAAQQKRAADEYRFCPACHALLEESSVYCDVCGTDTPRQ